MMKTKSLCSQFQFLAVVLLVATGTAQLQAQAAHSHLMTAQPKRLTQSQGALLQIVRDSTARFKDVSAAEGAGYQLAFGCVTGPDAGAMGLHYVNGNLVAHPPLMPNGEPDPTQPQIVIYEPLADGSLHLIGADYLIFASVWDPAHPNQGAPQMMGQLFHYFEFPNRFGLPAFYTLHVWAWKDNPNGAFVNWHPNVSCATFSGQAQ
jgi:hypothetical protein